MPRVSSDLSRRSRGLLDSHFDEWQQLRGLAHPSKGWIHAIREALGMSAAALASQLGVTAGAVIRLEQSEAADRIQLDSLRRTADALGCDLVYLLVPRRPLTTVVRERARELAHAQIVAMEQNMRLDDQAPGAASEMEDQLTEELIARGGLWSTARRSASENRSGDAGRSP